MQVYHEQSCTQNCTTICLAVQNEQVQKQQYINITIFSLFTVQNIFTCYIFTNLTNMETWSILAQIFAILAFVYYYFNRKYSFWSSRGISGPPVIFPFGNLLDSIRYGQVNVEPKWAAKYGPRYYGIYRGFTPVLTILDPELIKTVLVKDFPIFVNRSLSTFKHEILSKHLFASEDEMWRRIRSITSPSFSSGKLRGMHVLMDKSINDLAAYFDKVIAKDIKELNIKEVMMGLTIDIIAATSFGTKTNANDDREKQNPFLVNGIKFFEFSWLKIATQTILPKKFNQLIGNTSRSDPRSTQFFIDLSREIVRQRKSQMHDKNFKKPNDLVQLLVEAFVYEEDLKKINYDHLTATDGVEVEETKTEHNSTSVKKTLSESEIIAQCIIFFVAGFETTATTLSNCLYNLAVTPDVQDRLVEHIEAALAGVEDNSAEYFEVVTTKIPYLEATIKETLRLYPPVPRLVRRVGVESYNLGGVILKKDMSVEIPTYAIHHMSKFYPQPEAFQPERFLAENKHELVPYTYLPFGAGPRNCVGMRFAYQEMQLCLARIIRKYRFSTTPNTKVPMEFNKIGIISAKNIPLSVSRR